jgi:hypothetical protein
MLDVVEGVALAGYDVGQLVEEGRSQLRLEAGKRADRRARQWWWC